MAGPHDGVAVGDFGAAKAGPSRLKIAVIIVVADVVVVTVVVVAAANGVPRNEGEGTTRRRVVSRSSRSISRINRRGLDDDVVVQVEVGISSSLSRRPSLPVHHTVYYFSLEISLTERDGGLGLHDDVGEIILLCEQFTPPPFDDNL
jgi:hypothetical protein